MTSTPVENLRIHFYGVQGSGSIFPSLAERQQVREVLDLELLEKIFEHLNQFTGSEGVLTQPLEDIIGGPLTAKTLRTYRQQLQLSIPRVYGGWTTCVRIETADGYEIVLDCGSGFRICAQDIMEKWGDAPERHLYILGSHSHYDHTEGFDQAAICFDPRNHIHIYGNRQFLQALDQNLGIFSHHVDANLKGIQTPLHYELMPAQFHSCEIRSFQRQPPNDNPDPLAHGYHDLEHPFNIGQTQIQAFAVFHPSPCLAYRFDHGGKTFVFCTDHELRRGADLAEPLQVASQEAEARLCHYSQGVDLLYRDGQFLRAEYDGHLGVGAPQGVSRIDWGHSCIEDVVDMAIECQVKQTLIGHHDPNRNWSERNWFDEVLKRKSDQSGLCIELAQAETVIDL